MKLCNLRFFLRRIDPRRSRAASNVAPTDEAPAAFARSCSSPVDGARAPVSPQPRAAPLPAPCASSASSPGAASSPRARAPPRPPFGAGAPRHPPSRRRRSPPPRASGPPSFARFSDSRRERDSIARCRRSITLPPRRRRQRPPRVPRAKAPAAGIAAVAAHLAAIRASLRARRSSRGGALRSGGRGLLLAAAPEPAVEVALEPALRVVRLRQRHERRHQVRRELGQRRRRPARNAGFWSPRARLSLAHRRASRSVVLELADSTNSALEKSGVSASELRRRRSPTPRSASFSSAASPQPPASSRILDTVWRLRGDGRFSASWRRARATSAAGRPGRALLQYSVVATASRARVVDERRG